MNLGYIFYYYLHYWHVAVGKYEFEEGREVRRVMRRDAS